jgi:ribosome hibernation promoting factor
MQVLISARGLTISATYRASLQERVAKAAGRVPKPIEARVMLTRERNRRTAAITLLAKHHTFRSEETALDLAAAVDAALAALTRQVRQLKDRLRGHKPAPRKALQRLSADPDAAGAPALEARQVPLKPMSVEEALEQIGLGHEPFVVFTNARTDTMNILYRRRGGGYGLVEPVV